VETAIELSRVLTTGRVLPVTVWPFSEVLGAVDWSTVIDARMRKRAVPEGSMAALPNTVPKPA
jgi:xanthine dehydrogenase accessory factor